MGVRWHFSGGGQGRLCRQCHKSKEENESQRSEKEMRGTGDRNMGQRDSKPGDRGWSRVREGKGGGLGFLLEQGAARQGPDLTPESTGRLWLQRGADCEADTGGGGEATATPMPKRMEAGQGGQCRGQELDSG
jgi:hypothetical protein